MATKIFMYLSKSLLFRVQIVQNLELNEKKNDVENAYNVILREFSILSSE